MVVCEAVVSVALILNYKILKSNVFFPQIGGQIVSWRLKRCESVASVNMSYSFLQTHLDVSVHFAFIV